MMKTKEVRIDVGLNKALWAKGVRNVRGWAAAWQRGGERCRLRARPRLIPPLQVPRRVRVRISRKRNDDEDATEDMYSLVTFVEVSSFANLGTKPVEA